MVVVDTSVFSLYLRRDQQLPSEYLDLFLELFEKDQIVLLGFVYQELLSGIRHQEQFERLSDTLDGFDIQYADKVDHQTAAQYFNTCRSGGVQGSSIDFLICAMSSNRGLSILSLDQDFESYAKHLPIKLLKPK